MSKEQPSYYAIVPAHVRYDKRLTPNMKLMYGELTALSNKYGSCWATNKYFGELYDVSHKTAGEWINSLARCGHIFVSVDKERGNRRSITLPEAKMAKMDSYPEKDGEGYPEKDGEENENLPYMPESNNTSVNNTSRISNTAPTDQNRSVRVSVNLVGFDEFWNAYPRKVNRRGAEKAWSARVREKVLVPDEVMTALANYTKSCAGKELEYVMHPSTFLGPSTRWKDYLVTAPKRIPSSVASDGKWTCTMCRKQYGKDDPMRIGGVCVACEKDLKNEK